MRPLRSTIQNLLLLGLDEADFNRIAPALRHVMLPLKEIVERPGETIQRIVFPDAGMISIVASANREDELEVGIIGYDGMTGLAILHGTDRTPERTFVQIEGAGWELSADDFRTFIAERTGGHEPVSSLFQGARRPGHAVGAVLWPLLAG